MTRSLLSCGGRLGYISEAGLLRLGPFLPVLSYLLGGLTLMQRSWGPVQDFRSPALHAGGGKPSNLRKFADESCCIYVNYIVESVNSVDSWTVSLCNARPLIQISRSNTLQHFTVLLSHFTLNISSKLLQHLWVVKHSSRSMEYYEQFRGCLFWRYSHHRRASLFTTQSYWVCYCLWKSSQKSLWNNFKHGKELSVSLTICFVVKYFSKNPFWSARKHKLLIFQHSQIWCLNTHTICSPVRLLPPLFV